MPKAQTAKPPMKISGAAIHSAPPRKPIDTAQELWTVAAPPPGVVPDNAPRLANDDVLTGMYSYAAGSCAGGLGGLNGIYAGYYAFPGFPYLAALVQISEYRQAVEMVAREMTRKWIRFKSKGKGKKSARIKAIEQAFTRFKVHHKFSRLIELGETFGRSHLFFDTGAADDELNLPLLLDRRTLPKGGLKDIRLVEPTWCYPAVYNSTNPLGDNYYVPVSWYVMQKQVHHSRLLTVVPHPVPDLLKAAYSFGGVSLVQMLQVAVNNFQRTRQSVADLVHSFSTPVLSTDMSGALNNGTGGDLALRVQMYNNYRDNSGCFVVNAPDGTGTGEDLKIIATPLGTLDALQAQSQEQQAAVIGCPLVVLLGYTPAGLNASAEDQIRVWYDRTHANQERMLSHIIETVLRAVQLNEFGDIDDEIGFEFVPLWQLNEEQLAAVQKSKADTDAVYLTEGVIGPEDVQEKLKSDKESPYHGMTLAPAPGPMVEEDPENPGGGETVKAGERDED